MSSLEKLMDVRFDALAERFDTLGDKNDAQFKAFISAIAESKAQAELTNLRVFAALSERVAVLETQRH